MNWVALPVDGGLYDQHPQLLDEWEVIFQEKSRYEEEKEEGKKDPLGSKNTHRPGKRRR